MIRRQKRNARFYVLGIAALTLIFSGTVEAQQKWSLLQLDPFNLLPHARIQWPTWAQMDLPEMELIPNWVQLPAVPDIPAELGKLHRTTKRNITNTVNWLNPFYEVPAPLIHRAPTGSRKTVSSSPRQESGTSSFWFPSFMREDSRRAPSRTVHEFLGRPRLGR